MTSTAGSGEPGGGRGFEVLPAALTGAAGTFDAEAESITQAAAMLQQRLAGLGNCWGDDPVGQRFAAGYGPAVTTVQGNIAALSVGLNRIAAALRAVAESYQLVDRAVDSSVMAGSAP